jgi:hypothetical protein
MLARLSLWIIAVFKKIEESAVFEPHQATLLKLAYAEAVEVLNTEYFLNDAASAKLTRLVIKIGRTRLRLDRGLASLSDLQAIASEASIRLLALNAGELMKISDMPAQPQ